MMRNRLLPCVKYSSLAAEHGVIFTNPLNKLKHYLQVPVFNEDEQAFEPSFQMMVAAKELFMPKIGSEVFRICRTIYPEKFPKHDLPEITVIGKSNVGKSSLLRSILADVSSVNIRVSKKPGSTRSLDFYNVQNKLGLVDVPGYGFCQPEWYNVVETYLKDRKNLVRTFLLIEGKSGLLNTDESALEMLEKLRIPYCTVLTKIDLATDASLLRNVLFLRNIMRSSKFCYPQPFLVSSHSGEGLAHLLAFIGHVTGNL